MPCVDAVPDRGASQAGGGPALHAREGARAIVIGADAARDRLDCTAMGSGCDATAVHRSRATSFTTLVVSGASWN